MDIFPAAQFYIFIRLNCPSKCTPSVALSNIATPFDVLLMFFQIYTILYYILLNVHPVTPIPTPIMMILEPLNFVT